MTNQNLIDQTIALAAVMQSCTLVDLLATTGSCPETQANGVLQSLFQTDPQTTLEVYGDYHAIKLGLMSLAKGVVKTDNPNILRYFTQILGLQRKLLRRNDLMQRLDSGIENTKARLAHFPITHENIQGSLADLYAQTVSKLTPRIMISGNVDQLSKEQVANRLRTLLLTAIRAGILWNQCGGTRIGFIFSQKKIMTTAQMLLQREAL